MRGDRQKVLRYSYPIELPLQYKLDGKGGIAGNGQTYAITGQIVRFRCDQSLPSGRRIRLTLAWPAVLPDDRTLNLCILGTITRGVLAEVEVRVVRYAFRSGPTCWTPRRSAPAHAF